MPGCPLVGEQPPVSRCWVRQQTNRRQVRTAGRPPHAQPQIDVHEVAGLGIVGQAEDVTQLVLEYRQEIHVTRRRAAGRGQQFTVSADRAKCRIRAASRIHIPVVALSRLVDADHTVGFQAQDDCAQVADLNWHALEFAHLGEIQARGLPGTDGRREQGLHFALRD